MITGPDGKFRVGPVPKGRYRLQAFLNDKVEPVNAFESAEAGSKNVIFKLKIVGE